MRKRANHSACRTQCTPQMEYALTTQLDSKRVSGTPEALMFLPSPALLLFLPRWPLSKLLMPYIHVVTGLNRL